MGIDDEDTRESMGHFHAIANARLLPFDHRGKHTRTPAVECELQSCLIRNADPQESEGGFGNFHERGVRVSEECAQRIPAGTDLVLRKGVTEEECLFVQE